MSEDKLYRLRYFKDGEWRVWVPDSAPWENKPFGREIPAIVVSEGILALRSQFPIRITEVHPVRESD